MGGLLTGWFQRANTETLVAAELNKLGLQLDGEAKKRFLGRKQDWLVEFVPELVTAADPELHSQFDYGKVVTLVQRIELLLDPQNAIDQKLNSALHNLAFAVQAAATGNRDMRNYVATAQSH